MASRASIIARPDRQRALVHAPRSLGRRERLGVVCKAGGEVLVAGATGQQAARIALALAKSGYKVTAGVDDVAVAQEAIAFARKVELLLPKEAEAVRAVELDLSNPETLDAALPRCGKSAAQLRGVISPLSAVITAVVAFGCCGGSSRQGPSRGASEIHNKLTTCSPPAGAVPVWCWWQAMCRRTAVPTPRRWNAASRCWRRPATVWRSWCWSRPWAGLWARASLGLAPPSRAPTACPNWSSRWAGWWAGAG